jgi:hypothetical protein
VGYAPLRFCVSSFVVSPYPISLSFPHCLRGVTVGVIPSIRLRALTRCLCMREASLRLRSHNGVGASVEGLRNPGKQKVGKELENKKPQIPEKRQSKAINTN